MNQDLKRAAENIWLCYFNDYLYEHNIISEKARNQMLIQIHSRKSENSA